MFNSFKFNQTKFNSESNISIDVVLGVSVLNISSSAKVPTIAVTASTRVATPEDATGSGVKSKKRRTRKFELRFNIDGIKSFKLTDKFISIVGTLLSTYRSTIKVNGTVSKSLQTVLDMAGSVQTNTGSRYVVAGTKQFTTSSVYDLSALQRTYTKRAFTIAGTKLTNSEHQLVVSSHKRFDTSYQYGVNGQLKSYLNEDKIVQGKRDILPLLVALDLIEV